MFIFHFLIIIAENEVFFQEIDQWSISTFDWPKRGIFAILGRNPHVYRYPRNTALKSRARAPSQRPAVLFIRRSSDEFDVLILDAPPSTFHEDRYRRDCVWDR